MAKNRYRVVKQLPWIEGGRPAPGWQWEGGRSVVYEPGQSVELEDRDLGSIYHHLEPINDAGRDSLEASRAEREKPARRIAVADLHPRAIEWLTRALEERLRRQGKFRELCLRMVARGDDPADEDLAAALEDPQPPPRELLDYVASLLRGQWRKPGRKPPRTTAEDLYIQSYYHLKVEELRAHFERQRQKRAPIKRRAAAETAAHFGISPRTVERIVSPLPLTKTSKV